VRPVAGATQAPATCFERFTGCRAGAQGNARPRANRRTNWVVPKWAAVPAVQGGSAVCPRGSEGRWYSCVLNAARCLVLTLALVNLATWPRAATSARARTPHMHTATAMMNWAPEQAQNAPPHAPTHGALDDLVCRTADRPAFGALCSTATTWAAFVQCPRDSRRGLTMDCSCLQSRRRQRNAPPPDWGSWHALFEKKFSVQPTQRCRARHCAGRTEKA
jgi:hypothetical protein